MPEKGRGGGGEWGGTTEAEFRRETTQQSVLSSLAGGEGWRGDKLYCDMWAVPPAATYCTACPGKELRSCVLLAIPAAAAASILLNVHKKLKSPKSYSVGRGQSFMYR